MSLIVRKSGFHLATKRQAVLAVFLTALQLMFPASSQAAEPVAEIGTSENAQASRGAVRFDPQLSGLVNASLLAAFQTIASQNQCISYTYDHNGNITAKIDQPFSAAPTWGSSAYGCFTWTAP